MSQNEQTEIYESDDSPKEESLEKEILETALKRFHSAEEFESEIRKEALDDIKFSIGEQWPTEVKSARELDKRPCLTINRIPQFVRQITNDQRQNRPAIKVSPVDDQADVDTAKILQGLIRHIEYSSNADTAYDVAFDSAVRASFGYFRVITDYCDPMSFDQEIRIKSVPDRFSAYLDPNYRELDGSDANWGFVFEEIDKDEFKALYPDAKLNGMSDWQALNKPDWINSNTVRIAEYFYKEFRKTTICMMSDGSVAEEKDLPSELPQAISVKSKRETVATQIKWCKINGVEILDKTDWPGKWIPIIPVLGEQVMIEGKKSLSGVVRYAKDPQRMYNYWKSSETETIALAPRAPFIGAEGQFAGHEAEWKTANVKNHAFLQYKPTTIAGQQAPPPTRNVFEPPVQAITQASQFAAEDLKATTGIYDASLGNRSNEQSGVAIQRRNIQAQTSNFHLVDNLSKSIRHCGRIVVDLIPHIYDTARAVRILGEDGSQEIVKINEMFNHNGKPALYDVGFGKYDVTIDEGPSYQTKRQEAVASMVELTGKYPQLMQVAGDLLVKNMDWPGASDVADRIKKTLPPGLAEDKNAQQQPLPPQVQQQMTQMGQMIDQLTQELRVSHDILDKKKFELASRERIEMAKLQVEAEIAMAKMGSQESQTLLKHQVGEIETKLQFLDKFLDPNLLNPAGAPQAPAQGMNQQQPTGGQQSPGQPMGV